MSSIQGQAQIPTDDDDGDHLISKVFLNTFQAENQRSENSQGAYNPPVNFEKFEHTTNSNNPRKLSLMTPFQQQKEFPSQQRKHYSARKASYNNQKGHYMISDTQKQNSLQSLQLNCVQDSHRKNPTDKNMMICPQCNGDGQLNKLPKLKLRNDCEKCNGLNIVFINCISCNATGLKNKQKQGGEQFLTFKNLSGSQKEERCDTCKGCCMILIRCINCYQQQPKTMKSRSQKTLKLCPFCNGEGQLQRLTQISTGNGQKQRKHQQSKSDIMKFQYNQYNEVPFLRQQINQMKEIKKLKQLQRQNRVQSSQINMIVDGIDTFQRVPSDFKNPNNNMQHIKLSKKQIRQMNLNRTMGQKNMKMRNCMNKTQPNLPFSKYQLQRMNSMPFKPIGSVVSKKVKSQDIQRLQNQLKNYQSDDISMFALEDLEKISPITCNRAQVKRKSNRRHLLRRIKNERQQKMIKKIYSQVTEQPIEGLFNQQSGKRLNGSDNSLRETRPKRFFQDVIRNKQWFDSSKNNKEQIAKEEKAKHQLKIQGQKSPYNDEQSINIHHPHKSNDEPQDDQNQEQNQNDPDNANISINDDDDIAIDEEEEDNEDQNTNFTRANSISNLKTLKIPSFGNIQLLESPYKGRQKTFFFSDIGTGQLISHYEEYKKRIINNVSKASVKRITFRIPSLKAYHALKKILELGGAIQTFDNFEWTCFWGKIKKDLPKDNLFTHINYQKKRFPVDYNFIPKSYLTAKDWDQFIKDRRKASKKKLWIYKPTAQACGRGISLIAKHTKVKKKQGYLISEYIQDPHLIDGYKYDLRIYVVVTGLNPLKIYMYKQGLCRVCTEKYSTKQLFHGFLIIFIQNRKSKLTNKFTHLTNFSINKNSEKFKFDDDQEENRYKLSFTNLREIFTKKKLNYEKVMRKIKKVLVKTFISVEKGMQEKFKQSYTMRNTFYELYGVDILLSAKLKPWLIEVNMCPSLNLKTPIDKKVKLPLLTDIMNLVGFTPYMPKKESNNKFSKNQSTQQFKKEEDKIFNIQDLNSDNCVEKLSAEDWNMLFEFDEEFHRKGDFDRIFPNRENVQKYEKYFLTQRYNNVLVQKYLLGKENILEKVCQKVHFPVK